MSHANWLKFKGNDTALNCSRALVPTLVKVIEGTNIVADVGNLGELGKLLQSSGSSEEIVEVVSFVLQQLKSATNGSHLASIAKRLETASSDERQLLVCILSGECSLGNHRTVYMSIQRNFHVGSKTPPRSRPENEPRSALVLMGGPSVRKMQLLQSLPHEISRAADFILVSDWIDANRKLKTQGGRPDSLFQSYVQMSDGEAIVDKNFMYVFLESRGYAADFATLKPLIPASNLDESLAALKAIAMRTIMDGTGNMAQQLGFTEQNVIDNAIKLGQRMELTIAMTSYSHTPDVH